jgi:hypothetical protein
VALNQWKLVYFCMRFVWKISKFLLRHAWGKQPGSNEQEVGWNSAPRYVMPNVLLPENETWLPSQCHSSDGLRYPCWFSSVSVDYVNDCDRVCSQNLALIIQCNSSSALKTTIKLHEEREVELLLFLTFALDAGEWSASRSATLIRSDS